MVSFVMYHNQSVKRTARFQKKADERILENLRTKYPPITMAFPGCVKVKKEVLFRKLPSKYTKRR